MPKEAITTSSKVIYVRCTDSQKALIEHNARRCHLTPTSYLRNLGLGYSPKSLEDLKAVDDLVKVSGDLGRLGGLLKWWLVDDVRVKDFEEAHLRLLVSRIETTLDELLVLVRSMSRPNVRSDPQA